MASSTGPTFFRLKRIPDDSPFRSIPVFLPKPKSLIYLNNLSLPNLFPRDTKPGFKTVSTGTLKLIVEVLKIKEKMLFYVPIVTPSNLGVTTRTFLSSLITP